MPDYSQLLPQIFGSPAPQQEEQNFLQQVELRRREEEERKRREEEAQREKLMRILEQSQQQPGEEEMPRRQIADILARYSNPQRDAQVAAMRAQTPDTMANQMAGEFWGQPKSTAGKIGKGALQLASGFFGVQTPDFRAQALKQYQAQQAALNAEDATQGKLLAADLGAWAKESDSKRRADTAVKVAEERSRALMGAQLINERIKKADRDIKEAEIQGKQVGIDAKAAVDQIKAGLMQDMSQYQAMAGLKDPALITQVMREKFGDKAAMEYAQLTEAFTQAKNAKPETPGSSRTTMTPVLERTPAGLQQLTTKATTSTTAGRPAIGNPNAASQALGGILGDPRQYLIQPANPQMPSPLPVQPRPMQQGQGPTPNTGTGEPAATEVPKGSRPLAPPISNFPGSSGGTGLKAWEVPRGNMLYVGAKTPTPKEAAEDRASVMGINKIANLNNMLTDAYIKGDLQKQFGGLRSMVAAVGGNKIFNEYYKKFGTDAQKQLETDFDFLNTGTVSAYLKSISGAQVAAAEFDRVSKMFPNAGDTPENNVQLAYTNTVMSAALLNLEKMGILNEKTAAQIGNALFTSMAKNRDSYLTALRQAAKKPTDAKQRASLNAYMDMGKITQDVLRNAFPEYAGRTLTIPDDKNNRDINVYIPYGNTDMERMNREMKKKKAAEALRRSLQE